MEWDSELEAYVLSSGRRVEANMGIIGLCPAIDGYPERHAGPSEGCDGGIDVDGWTKEENMELGAYMIELWVQWMMRA